MGTSDGKSAGNKEVWEYVISSPFSISYYEPFMFETQETNIMLQSIKSDTDNNHAAHIDFLYCRGRLVILFFTLVYFVIFVLRL